MFNAIAGFPEFTPGEQIVFEYFKKVISRHYEMAGAVPIETPVVEKMEVLLKKANNENRKQMFVVNQLHSKQDAEAKLGLHFDLTLPLARYVTEYSGHLIFPFKRYQIQPVFRGERQQKGRFRQFYQCDIDVVGEEQLSFINDADVIQIIVNIFNELEFGEFIVELNNRKVLIGYFQGLGLISESDVSQAIKIVDDFEKQELPVIKERMQELGLGDEKINQALEFFRFRGNVDDTIGFLKTIDGNETFDTGVAELEEVISYLKMFEVDESTYQINLKIARGLDYYSGTIMETRLIKYPGLGSICSGGRYDRLTEQLGSKKVYPGVGISIGLTRLLDKLFEAGIVKPAKPNVAPVLITSMDSACLPVYLKLGANLRKKGVATEVYTESKKLSAQMKYANRKGFNFVVIASQSELDRNQVLVRRMKDGEQWLFDMSVWQSEIIKLITTQEV